MNPEYIRYTAGQAWERLARSQAPARDPIEARA
jgi:hypothetical protein